MTHSPAPWSVRRPTEAEIVGHVRKYPAIIAADGFSVCSFGATAKHGKRSPETVEADVALAAAAPELLQALRELIEAGKHLATPATHDGLTLADAQAKARMVIRKSEGLK